MMLSVALATAILLLLVFFWYVATARMREIAQCIDVLPGDKRYPIIGTSLGFITSTREGECRFYCDYASDVVQFKKVQKYTQIQSFRELYHCT